MQVRAFEGIIENGQILLTEKVDLPDKTKVYVIIPEAETRETIHIYSPRLVHPEQFIDFKKEVIEEKPNAGI